MASHRQRATREVLLADASGAEATRRGGGRLDAARLGRRPFAESRELALSLWRQLTRGLRTLSNPTAAAQDVDDEVRDYFDQATAELIARGRTPEQARREARLELGTATAVGEEVRAYGWEDIVGLTIPDL